MIKNRYSTLAGFILLCSIILLANSTNPPNGRTGAPGDSGCNSCHSGNNPSLDGSVNFSGLPAIIAPNTTYNITVTVDNPNGNGVKGGFQWVALNSTSINVGSMSNAGSNTSITNFGGRTYHEHQPAQTFGGSNQVSYTVDWTSPAGPDNETITFWAGSVISNGSGNTSGDRVTFNSLSTVLMGGNTPPTVAVVLDKDASCSGEADGEATANVTGGMPDYTYLWPNGEMTQTAISLAAGTHIVTVTDANMQTGTGSVVVSEPAPLVITIDATFDEDCSSENGAAMVSATGGTGPYMFEWSNGDVGPNLSNVSSGNYEIQLLDVNFCSKSMNVFIDNNPGNIVITKITDVDPSCNGSSDGTLEVFVSNASGDATYAWDNGVNTALNANIAGGTYTLVVSDDLGCTASETYTLDEPSAIVVSSVSIVDATCTDSDGSIEVVASGGAGSFTYSWDTGVMGPILSNVPGGDYTVEVLDGTSCVQSQVFTVPSGSGNLDLSIVTQTPPLCNGDSTGVIEVLATNAVGMAEYVWSTEDSTAIISNLPAGTYTVSITDDAGCEKIQSFTFDDPDAIVLDLSSTPATCSGIDDGGIGVTASGGTGNVNLTWQHGGALTDLAAGVYYVTASDDNACNLTDSIEVGVVNTLGISTSATDVLCFGDENGSLSIDNITGAIGPVSYNWSNGDTSIIADSLAFGYYSVVVTDSLNCMSTFDSLLVNQPDSFYLEPKIVTLPGCAGQSFGTITALPFGGTPPYNYSWAIGFMTDTINVTPGFYPVTVTDANMCSSAVFVNLTIGDDTPPEINAQNFTLYVDETGQTSMIDTSMFDLGSSDDCELAGFTFDPNPLNCDQDSFEYPIQLEDINGNIAFDTLIVSIIDTFPPEIFCIDDFITARCDTADYNIPLVFDNCSADLVLISGPAPGDSIVVGANEVVFEATDSQGNKTQCSFTITSEPSIDYSIQTTDVSCFNFQDGTAAINVTSDFLPLLLTGDFNDPDFLEAGTYHFNIIDGASCTAMDSFVINEPDVLLISNFDITNSSTSNSMDGSIDIMISGGVQSYMVEWFLNGVLISTDEDISGLAPGDYTCIVTDSNDCTYESIVFTVDATVGTNDLSELGNFKVYPNPTNGQLYIELSETKEPLVSLEFMDIRGKVLMKKENPNDKEMLELTSFERGIYLLKFNFESQSAFKKVMLQ